MADQHILTTEKRTERGSGPAGRLRRGGKVPAVVYGLGVESIAISVPARDLSHILGADTGANTLITLQLDGDAVLALARQIQRDPVRGRVEHVDFVRVRRDVAVTADVPVHLLGEAAGAREGGVVDQQVFSVTVEAKPEDIPASIELDVSSMEIGDQRHVSDLETPPGVSIMQDPEELVVSVAAPRVVAAEEGAAAEGAEGETPAGEAAAEGESAQSGE
ncbi:MAG: 50S ribosomal protein L25 [Actinobacteria bacterium]|nr:50S ribosomal protein L25 [Actinomycetota bacterium]